MTEWFSREDDSISGLCSPLAACLHNKGSTCIYGCHIYPLLGYITAKFKMS